MQRVDLIFEGTSLGFAQNCNFADPASHAQYKIVYYTTLLLEKRKENNGRHLIAIVKIFLYKYRVSLT